jgi:hypothetical protein
MEKIEKSENWSGYYIALAAWLVVQIALFWWMSVALK